jgi:2-polyprenyl-3-methyl-5-hydroxy-6-metoxy-1,4-benzoquinol methylase
LTGESALRSSVGLWQGAGILLPCVAKRFPGHGQHVRLGRVGPGNKWRRCVPVTLICRGRVISLRRPVLTNLQYRVLRAIRPADPPYLSGAAYAGKSKLEVLLGDMLDEVRGKVVLDFGCGEGKEAIELVGRGAARVIGIDLNEACLEQARRFASIAGVQDRIEFARDAGGPVDLIVSIDSFEHFEDPAAILRLMCDLLRPGGAVVASFGPTWYHPLGGHLFSLFPWAHLLFSEAALLRWRQDRRRDRPRNFRDAGLNQITIRRFEELVAASPFVIERLQLVPIRRARRLHNALTREFLTAIVQAKLRKAG